MSLLSRSSIFLLDSAKLTLPNVFLRIRCNDVLGVFASLAAIDGSLPREFKRNIDGTEERNQERAARRRGCTEEARVVGVEREERKWRAGDGGERR